ncbi:MAG TPA: PepSY domain-containing protein, partial [Gemmatimonadales bacterium]|nr:PepSY domain-containing protein [Gemmatimonadales bacterium]
LLRIDHWRDMPVGNRARRMIEPVHTGMGWGLTSKVLFFLATLFGASFPLTGFLMYRAGKRATA